MNNAKQSVQMDNPPPDNEKNPARYIYWTLGVAVLFLLAYGFFYVGITSQKPLDSFFSILEEQGYKPNIGFSGNYAPGNIIQVLEKAADGSPRQLSPPLVVLWKEQCFPEQVLRKSLYMLPQSSGERTAQLNLGAEVLGTMMPVLQLDSAAAASYNMKLENTRVFSFAKLDLSQNFSDQCVRNLKNDLRLGNKPEWYAVIIEAIVVDAISFEINWRDNSTLDARNKVKQDTKKTLGTIVKQNSSAAQPVQGTISLASDNKKTTVIKASGEVIVGYRARQLEPVFSE